MFVKRAVAACLGPVGLLAAAGTTAHHSVTANFDSSHRVEIRGTVVEFKLRSPHSSVVVDGLAFVDGVQRSEAVERWEIESGAAPGLRARGYLEDSIRPGDRIVVVGAPHRRGLLRANSSTFLREDGGDFASAPPTPTTFHPELRARSGLGAAPPIEVKGIGVERIEGRWQPPFQQEGTESALPLNEAGLAAWRAYDQTRSPANTCEPMSIPVVFNAPSYFVDIRLDERLAVVRNQAYDIARTVPLTDTAAPADPAGQFGTVNGRIEGEALVIDSWNYPVSRWGLGAATQINGGGADVPSSPQKTVTERFSVSPDGQTLIYEYTLNDPVYMARPHTARIELARVPEETPMYPYECDPASASMFSRAPGASIVEDGK